MVEYSAGIKTLLIPALVFSAAVAGCGGGEELGAPLALHAEFIEDIDGSVLSMTIDGADLVTVTYGWLYMETVAEHQDLEVGAVLTAGGELTEDIEVARPCTDYCAANDCSTLGLLQSEEIHVHVLPTAFSYDGNFICRYEFGQTQGP